MCQKTPCVAYCIRLLQTTGKKALYEIIEDMPLKTRDYAFLADVIEGLDNEALMKKYKKSQSRITQWKRRSFEKLHQFIIAQN